MSNEKTSAARKCAALARLQISDQQAEALGNDFERILKAFEGLTQLDVSAVEPMYGAAQLHNILRADERRESLPTEKLLAPAPKTQDGFFCVPKTVDGDA